MQSLTIALAATAVVAAAGKVPVVDNHQKAYATIYGGQVPQAVQPVVAQPTVVQNAANAEPTVTETVTSGAGTNALSLGAVFLAGSALLSYF
ncbi:hypothetical protein GGF46_001797 [Coemansia sp. RSA 552]|nr:hypothetical protein GGF46_001797 [Coemansia sp. RSA 552]